MKLRMPIIIAFLTIGLAVLLQAAVHVQAQDKLPAADEVLKNVRAESAKLTNYSYEFHRFDLADEFVKKRHVDGLKSYEVILNVLEKFNRGKTKPSLREGYIATISTCSFVSPFHIQVTFDQNEYLPAFLEGSRVFYNPKINDEEVSLKEPNIGLVFRKPTSNDSAVSLVINWKYQLMELNCAIANGGSPVVTGIEKYDGGSLYVVDTEINKGSEEWKYGCGGETYGIPELAAVQINRDMGTMDDRIMKHKGKQGILRFYVDTKTWYIMKVHVLFGDLMTTESIMKKMKPNGVNEKKLLKPKKKKKKKKK